MQNRKLRRVYILVFNAAVNLPEVFEEALEKIKAMSQIRNAHDFTARVHRELWHPRIDRANAGSS